jgi:hypothetical protein
MASPSPKAGVILLVIGVNLLEGDVTSTPSKRLTPLQKIKE